MSLNIEHHVAVAQSLHPRLGQASPMRCLDGNILGQIFSMVYEQYDVQNENRIPLLIESAFPSSYSNIKVNGAGNFQYRVVLGETVCDTGAVPVWKDENCGVVHFFSPVVANCGPVKVAISSMAGNESVFLQIGCWKEGDDTGPFDTFCVSTGKKFCRDTTSTVVGGGKHQFPFPLPFAGFVELWTE